MAIFSGRCIGIVEKPVQWPDCLRSEAVNYLRLGHILKPLLSMPREKTVSNRASDRPSGSESAHVRLRFGVIPCRRATHMSQQMFSVYLHIQV